MSLAPTNEESAWTGKKTSVQKKEKMSDLMATLEFVQTYLDYLLVITKGSLEDHLEKLSMVLTRLQDAGLKINVHLRLNT